MSRLIFICPVKVVRFLCLLHDIFKMHSRILYNMNPDQTGAAPLEQSDLCSYCLQKRLPKYNVYKQMREQTKKALNDGA